MLLMIPGIFHAQVNLNASALLEDEAGNPVAGVSVFFGALTSGAIYTMQGVTDESGVAAVEIGYVTNSLAGQMTFSR